MGGAGTCIHGGDAGWKGKHPVLFCRCRSWLWRLLLSTWKNLESPWRWASEQQVRDYLHLVSLWAWLLKLILTSWTRRAIWSLRADPFLGLGVPEGVKRRKWAELMISLLPDWGLTVLSPWLPWRDGKYLVLCIKISPPFLYSLWSEYFIRATENYATYVCLSERDRGGQRAGKGSMNCEGTAVWQ